MGAVYIKCPVTGRRVWTGIELDRESLTKSPEFVALVYCSYCRCDHEWTRSNAKVAGEDEVQR